MNNKLNRVQDWLSLAEQANWSVSKLAKLCAVSTRTLERHFLQTQGTPPKVWLAGQRQKQALELLSDGSSVKETASRLGYQHATTFAREFKKLSGQCPTTLTSIPKIEPDRLQNVA